MRFSVRSKESSISLIQTIPVEQQSVFGLGKMVWKIARPVLRFVGRNVTQNVIQEEANCYWQCRRVGGAQKKECLQACKTHGVWLNRIHQVLNHQATRKDSR